MADLNTTIEKFVDAFNRNDLDEVMTYFADDAVYKPGDGTTAIGKQQIRATFAPQFAMAFGAMRFDEHDRQIDQAHRKAAIRWVCRHDLSQAKPAGMSMLLQRLFVQTFTGKKFGWEGIDVFHFTPDGKIKGKFTYANYSRPRILASLG